MATTVVHLKRRNGVVVQDCDTYIGRPMYQGGWRLPGSKWANPFRLKMNQTAADWKKCLRDYEAHVRASPELLAALPELRGKRLGCWCVEAHCRICYDKSENCGHEDCHGKVLVRMVAELDNGHPPDAVLLESQIPDNDPLWSELGL